MMRLLIFFACSVFSAVGLFAQPLGDLQLAYASRIVYFDEFHQIRDFPYDDSPLRGYRIADFTEDLHLVEKHRVGFRGLALKNEATKDLIIAFRGTDVRVKENILADMGIFLELAGEDHLGAIQGELAKFRAHYGYDKMLAKADMAVAVGRVASGLLEAYGSEPVKDFAKGAAEFALTQAFGNLGLGFLDPEDIKFTTRAIVDNALAFYEKTIHGKGTRQDPGMIRQGIHALWHGHKKALPELDGYTIRVTGHSLGGFLAQIVAGTHGSQAVAFSAPGAAEYARKTKRHVKDPGGIRNICRENDFVSRFGTHLGRTDWLRNFWEVSPVGDELQAAWAVEESACLPRRQEALRLELAARPDRLRAYERARELHDKKSAEYDAAKAAYDARLSAMSWGEWAKAPRFAMERPVAPVPPPEPTLDTVYAAAPNRLGRTYDGLRMAKAKYGLEGYMRRNHDLNLIIRQLELEMGLPLVPAIDPPPPADPDAPDARPGPAAPPAPRLGPAAPPAPDAEPTPDAEPAPAAPPARDARLGR